MQILMVCLGNICRSPLAEGIMKAKLRSRNLDWKVESRGTGNWHVGQLPDPRSIATAKRHQIDITDQRAQQFSEKDFEDYDLILAMDQSNYSNIIAMAKGIADEEKVKLIMDFDPDKTALEVPDPYWNDDGFEQVFSMLDQACDKVIEAFDKAAC